MENIVYLEIFSHKIAETCFSISCPLETLIILSVHKYCRDPAVTIKFVVNPDSAKNDFFMTIDNCSYDLVNYNDLLWQVKSCKLPVVQNRDTVISGMCAVARQVCKLRKSSPKSPEHTDGLLGFRGNCLQAPNEVSVWTKFCEVDMLESVKCAFSCESDLNIVALNEVKRFEIHLSQPLRVHNVFKFLNERNLKNDVTKSLDQNESSVSGGNSLKDLDKDHNSVTERKAKMRKWKSGTQKNTVMDKNSQNEHLQSEHKFSEGPFLTLADIVLFPLFYIWVQSSHINHFAKHFPLICKWYMMLDALENLQPVKKILHTLKITEIDEDIFNHIPDVKAISLYKCDPKRSNPKRRLFTKENDIEAALNFILETYQLEIESNKPTGKLDWYSIPDGCNPFAGHLPDKRMLKKTQQLENLALAITEIAKDGDRIVDFCSGSGHLGILLAYLLPNCTVILLENKEQSLSRARDRVKKMGLDNVYFFHSNLDFYSGPFNIGVALHACGVATDLVMEKCVLAKANFVVCPCCYGSLHETDRLKYPRSNAFSYVPVSQYMCIGHAADQTHEGHAMYDRGVQCMRIIDSDRANFAMERKYTVKLSRLHPLTCTPKNMLLVGVYG